VAPSSASPVPHMDELPDLRERLASATVLFTDLDGTLFGRGGCLLCDGEGATSLDAATAVAALNAEGLRVVITSGRGSKQLGEVSRILGWRDFIAELGCVRSYDRGARAVYDLAGWPADALRAGETPYEAIERVGALAALRDAFPGRIEEHDPWNVEREVTHVLRGNVPVTEAQAVLNALPLPVALVDNGIIHPPRTGLTGVDEVHAYHLVPEGASKPRAIAADLIEHGLGASDALAIGDSAADVEMADAVGLMVCVANGLDDPALLARASGRANVAATRGRFGAGWRELAEAWLSARSLG
jgi:predicted mannosyl-3-phosphoglycerate phosphatase (HAD superfamily)